MNKKIIALMMAGVMVAGMPVSAGATVVSGSVGTEEVETPGTVGYVDTDVFSVTLPTNGCFNFTVDPQGILSAIDPTTYPEDLYPDGTAGYIIASEGSGAYINNKSSVPIKLGVEAYVESDNTGAQSTVNLLGTEQYDLINSGIDNNMWLTLDITSDEFAAEVAEDPAKHFTDGTSITRDTVVPYVIAVTQNGAPTAPAKGTQISFALDKAAYEFKGSVVTGATYELKANEEGDSVGLRLSGMVNTNADWSAYVDGGEPIIVKTIFDFAKLSTDYELSALDGRAHGVLADVEPQYYAGVDENGDPVAEAMEYVIGQGAIEIPFDFGAGANEVSVDSITVGGTTLDAADYKASNYVITLKTTGDIATELAAADADGAAIAITIVTSDTKTTTVNMTAYKLD